MRELYVEYTRSNALASPRLRAATRSRSVAASGRSRDTPRERLTGDGVTRKKKTKKPCHDRPRAAFITACGR